ncbi:MAG TPA: hypothetical protein VF546_00265 [Pyrinomonadaceae bacterium]|jgi:hypothetical protein
MSTSSRKQEAGPRATFVFKGRVRKLKSATMASVPVDERTAVVTVEEVTEAPDYLAGYAGQDITVRLAGRAQIKAGQELIFHATPWLYGDSIAVQAVRQEPVPAAGKRAGGPAPGPEERELRARLAAADLAVAGRVTEVRLPAAAAGAQAPPTRISEHYADWREAVIEVRAVVKGGRAPKRVVIRFPASTDIRWQQAPKFHAGQEGYFLLHRLEADKAPARRAPKGEGAAGARPRAALYTALDRADFQPAHEAGRLAALVAAEAARGES